jgi:hypothetical protein
LKLKATRNVSYFVIQSNEWLLKYRKNDPNGKSAEANNTCLTTAPYEQEVHDVYSMLALALLKPERSNRSLGLCSYLLNKQMIIGDS